MNHLRNLVTHDDARMIITNRLSPCGDAANCDIVLIKVDFQLWLFVLYVDLGQSRQLVFSAQDVPAV